MIELNSGQKRYLIALAHPLKPLVQIGKEGISEGVIEMTNRELKHHELIKVKLADSASLDKKEASHKLATATKSSLVQLIGKTIVLYRANPKRKKELRIQIPG
jgi:RNA-binding protein